MNQNQPKFFITHSHKDNAFARKLCDDLKARGLDGFFDVYSVKPGDNISAKIDEGLETCDVYVPILSHATLKSDWCKEEIHTARTLANKPGRNGRPRIIPILVEDCQDEMPPFLQARLYINFSGRYEEALNDLLTKGLGLSPRLSAVSADPISPVTITRISVRPRVNWLVPVGGLVGVMLVIVYITGNVVFGVFAQPTTTPTRVAIMPPTNGATAMLEPTTNTSPTTSVLATATEPPTPTRMPPTNTPTAIMTPTATPFPAAVKRLDNLDGLFISNFATNSNKKIQRSALHSAWFQDGTQILEANFDQLDIMDANGGNVKTIASVTSLLGPDASGYGYGAKSWFSDVVLEPGGTRIAVFYNGMVPSSSDQKYSQAVCPFVINIDGTEMHKLNGCQSGDHPRFWSVDAKWIIVWQEKDLKLYAYEVDGNRRVLLEQLGKLPVYDQRYWPWRVTYEPQCTAGDFWSCE